MFNRILRSPADLTSADLRALYDVFDAPIAALDCGKKCAPQNPSGKPFCCDICHAVPAAYTSEWDYLSGTTDLWHRYRDDECASPPKPEPASSVADETPPPGILPLACLGPSLCQRPNRVLSCRAFPFFPYISSDGRILGLACEWEFESVCWVISNLSQVTDEYRATFLRTFDHLLALFDEIFENYAYHSERMRAHYASKGKRFPLLHRNGRAYLVSPGSERMRRVEPSQLPKHGFYADK
jgi:hypothetical protein